MPRGRASTGGFTLAFAAAATLAFGTVLAGCAGQGQVPPERRAAPPVPERAEDVEPVTEGVAAPAKVLRTVDGEPVDLAERYRNGPTMLLFYRGGWCPYCNEQLGHLAEADATLAEMGVQILAVSPDRPAKLRETQIDDGQSYRLLSDSDMALAQAFGVAFRVADETVDQYRGFGVDLAEIAGEAHHLLPVPAVYLIDRDGVIRFAHWDADYRERLTAEALIEAAQQVVQ